jgi:hypothetical protein
MVSIYFYLCCVKISVEVIGCVSVELQCDVFKGLCGEWNNQVKKGEKRNLCRILVEKLEGKRPLGRPTRRWVNNIEMNLREIDKGGINWIDLA